MDGHINPMYWDRAQEKLIQRENYAGDALAWLYGSKLGKIFLYCYFSTRLHSWVYRQYKSSRLTRDAAFDDIEKFNINLGEFDIEKSNIHCYRDFFLRKFKKNMRPFSQENKDISAFAEGHYLGYEKTTPDIRYPVKGNFLSATQILENEGIGSQFEGGPVLICRLSPIDYHWFHFPTHGKVLSSYRRKGKVHAVNLVALRKKQDIFCTNEREISLLQTENLGRLAYVEVGAMGVGRIHQTYKNTEFKSGQEKGYFDFGASTVILFGEPGRWRPSQDILEHTLQQRETRIQLGQLISQA